MSLYRFYPLQSAEITDDVFKDDGIICKNATIDDVLKQKFPKFPDQLPSFHKIPKVYQDLLKLNTIIGKNSLYPARRSSFNDFHEGFCWIEPSFLKTGGFANGYESYVKAEQAKNGNIISEAEFNAMMDKIAEGSDGMISWYVSDSMGIVSFCLVKHDKKVSADYANMWGHYANGNHGVCIEFQVHNELLKLINNSSASEISLGWYDTNGNNKIYFLGGKVNYDCPMPLEINNATIAYYKNAHSKLLEKNQKLNKTDITSNDLILMEIITINIRFGVKKKSLD